MAGHQEGSQARPRRRSAIWRGIKFMFGGPVEALQIGRIVEGAELIGELASRIKTGPPPEAHIYIDDHRTLDLEYMAAARHVSIDEIHRQLRNRRRQTARATICYLGGGFGFLVLWAFEAFLTPTYTGLLYVVCLLGICSAMFLSAFYNAMVNWQIRTLRLGTVREFFRADESWWPS